MRLSGIQIQNYKGFKDSGPIRIGANWTVVVGQNSAGKTAFLDCFRFTAFVNKPYVSVLQPLGAARNPQSRLIVSAEFEVEEIKQLMKVHNQPLQFPVPIYDPEFAIKHFMEATNLALVISKVGGSGWESRSYPSHGLFRGADTQRFVNFYPSQDRQEILKSTMMPGAQDNLAAVTGGGLDAKAYVFNSERRIAAISPPQNNLELATDASNLPGALNFLMTSNYKRFEQFLDLVRQVLPNVEMVSVPPSAGNPNLVHIKVYNNGYAQGRLDLAIPLEECGTGIGQVLAVLFVVATAESGRIVVIDEPNSFLHPGASRTLMQLLRSVEFSKHQFIVTTHSPEMISATHPDELLTVRWEEHQSKIECQSGRDVVAIQNSLREVGVRLSDVYGYDAVIWVEGPTEEKCFPLLYSLTKRLLPPRTEFISVVNTGDFEGVNAETYLRAYRRLASRSALVPETVCISLDREGKPKTLCEEIQGKSGGFMRFLPRRTYENYLLHPRAIAALLSELDDGKIDATEIESWITEKRSEKKYFREPDARANMKSASWIVYIDAPKLLSDLWAHFTEFRHNFDVRKVECSTALTHWLVENEPATLVELVEYVSTLVRQPAPTHQD